MNGFVEETVIEEIRLAEESLRKAMESSDLVLLDKLVSPELLFTNHFGLRIGKEDDLAMHKSGKLNIDSINLSDMTLNVFSEFVFVSVKARIVSRFDGNLRDNYFMFTRAWKKQSDRWQVMVGHSSLIK